MSELSEKPVASRRKARGEGPQRREEILVAAERIFTEVGYAGATIRKIADVVGVSPTALYLHFPDKRAMLLEISAGALTALVARYREILAAESDPMARLRAIIRAYIEFGRSRPMVYDLLFSAGAGSGGDGDFAHPSGADAELFFQVLQDLEAAGRLRRDIRVTAQVIWASAHGLITVTHGNPWFKFAAMEDLIEAAIEGLIQGHFK